MQVLIRSATLILLRDSALGLETLLLQRHQRSRFLPDVWVFPGGGIESSDHAESEVLTAKNAAVRETFEEAHITVPSKNLQLISQWVTPEGVPKRFFTWFFIAIADEQLVNVDGIEMSASIWININDALDKHNKGELNLLPPTLISLERLKSFFTVDAALHYYKDAVPILFEPKIKTIDNQLVMLYAEDAEYEASNIADISLKHRCLKTADGWKYIYEGAIE